MLHNRRHIRKKLLRCFPDTRCASVLARISFHPRTLSNDLFLSAPGYASFAAPKKLDHSSSVRLCVTSNYPLRYLDELPNRNCRCQIEGVVSSAQTLLYCCRHVQQHPCLTSSSRQRTRTSQGDPDTELTIVVVEILLITDSRLTTRMLASQRTLI